MGPGREVPTAGTAPNSGLPAGAATVAGATVGSVAEPTVDSMAGGKVRRRPLSTDLMIGAALLLGGLYLLTLRLGWLVRPDVVLPLVVVAVGAVVAYTQLDEVERTRWADRKSVV